MTRLWYSCPSTLRFAISGLCFSVLGLNANAQDTEEEVEEIVVTGSQIKGAKITGSLAVSIFSSEDIEILGIDSGL